MQNQNESDPNQSLYEQLCTKYQSFIDLFREIVQLKTNETEEFSENICKLIENKEIDINAIITLVDRSARFNLHFLEGYYNILNTLKNRFKISYIGSNSYSLTSNMSAFFDPKLDEKRKNEKFRKAFAYHEEGTVIHCIFNDNISKLKQIIDETNLDLNMIHNNLSLLEWSCYYGSLQCFKFFRSNGLEATQKTLEFAFFGNNKEIINELINEFAPNSTCIEYAVKWHNTEARISISEQYSLEINPHVASFSFNLEIFFYLFVIKGLTANCFVCSPSFGMPALIEDLVKHDLNVEIKNDSGITALFDAARSNMILSIDKLVDMGADVNARNNYLETPLFYARQTNNSLAFDRLIYHGADVKAKNMYGETYKQANNNYCLLI